MVQLEDTVVNKQLAAMDQEAKAVTEASNNQLEVTVVHQEPHPVDTEVCQEAKAVTEANSNQLEVTAVNNQADMDLRVVLADTVVHQVPQQEDTVVHQVPQLAVMEVQAKVDTAAHLAVVQDTDQVLHLPDMVVHHQADMVQEAVEAQRRLCQEVTKSTDQLMIGS